MDYKQQRDQLWRIYQRLEKKAARRAARRRQAVEWAIEWVVKNSGARDPATPAREEPAAAARTAIQAAARAAVCAAVRAAAQDRPSGVAPPTSALAPSSQCVKCKETKPGDAFYTYRISGGELRYKSKCKQCARELQRRRRRSGRARPADPEWRPPSCGSLSDESDSSDGSTDSGDSTDSDDCPLS